jgi:hypothetical protein
MLWVLVGGEPHMATVFSRGHVVIPLPACGLVMRQRQVLADPSTPTVQSSATRAG